MLLCGRVVVAGVGAGGLEDMRERRGSLLHGWGADVEKGANSREGRAKVERARGLPKLQGVCSSHWSSSTLQASPLPTALTP